MTVLYSTRQATFKDLPAQKPTKAGESLRASSGQRQERSSSSVRTDISELPGFASFLTANPRHITPGTVIRELYRYVADLDLLVCGPQYWFYHGVDGKPTTAGGGSPIVSESRFNLEVCLPVQGRIPTALLPYFKQIPAFRCLAYRYEGPWEGLAGAYREMMQYIEDNQLKMNGVYAESFLHIDLEDPASQITEIQIGLI